MFKYRSEWPHDDADVICLGCATRRSKSVASSNNNNNNKTWSWTGGTSTEFMKNTKINHDISVIRTRTCWRKNKNGWKEILIYLMIDTEEESQSLFENWNFGNPRWYFQIALSVVWYRRAQVLYSRLPEIQIFLTRHLIKVKPVISVMLRQEIRICSVVWIDSSTSEWES